MLLQNSHAHLKRRKGKILIAKQNHTEKITTYLFSDLKKRLECLGIHSRHCNWCRHCQKKMACYYATKVKLNYKVYLMYGSTKSIVQYVLPDVDWRELSWQEWPGE